MPEAKKKLGRPPNVFTKYRNQKRSLAAVLLRKRQATLGYRAEEVAQAFGLTRATVYKMAKDGRIPSIKLGRRLRVFPKGAIKAMVKVGYQIKLTGEA